MATGPLLNAPSPTLTNGRAVPDDNIRSTMKTVPAVGAIQHVESASPSETETLRDDAVLIVGGGPVGLLLATVLASYGIPSTLLERNETTTRWPKMDLTNVRSMELFRKLGLADELRKQGVPAHITQPVLISMGLNEKEYLAKWDHPSVEQYRERIRARNDGTQPLEPWQRLSQAIFEKWLKSLCDENPLIDLRFGWKVTSAEELPGKAKIEAVNVVTGKKRLFSARYVAGCDGASSRVRRDLGIELDGGPIPGYMLLIHFKSRDLTRLFAQGRFWHIFFLGSAGLHGAIISQDEIDTFTTHLALPLNVDHSTISTHDAVYQLLGGTGDKYEIKIDEILVRSTYRPSIAVARHYCGPLERIFLAGDSAHQNIPTGGYGMNMGLGDAFDLGWKLAAIIRGRGGPAIMRSYETERRPVALMSVERSGVHMKVHLDTEQIIGPQAALANGFSETSSRIREAIREHYRKNDGENTDLGVEMGYRYKSPIIFPDKSNLSEPEWTPSAYIPSTWPGARAPHVFLKDGTPIFDHFGKYFTLVDFSQSDNDTGVSWLLQAAREFNIGVKHLRLVGEDQASKLWELPLVLVRPDGHVAWRSDQVESLSQAVDIMKTTAGYGNEASVNTHYEEFTLQKFSATEKTEVQTSQYVLEKMGEFQR